MIKMKFTIGIFCVKLSFAGALNSNLAFVPPEFTIHSIW